VAIVQNLKDLIIYKLKGMKQQPHKTARKKKDKKMHDIQNYIHASGSDSQLSQREIQTLELVSSGLDTQTIAGKLFISANTVNTHRKKIIKKLQADNMLQAVSIAFRNKILK
jgi:DNA-binding CsgD family transcriptional regulator